MENSFQQGHNFITFAKFDIPHGLTSQGNFCVLECMIIN